MELLLSMKLMMTRRRMLLSALIIVVGVVMGFVLLFHETFYGWAEGKIFPWEEDSFKGKLLCELENKLSSQGRDLIAVHPTSFYGLTRTQLKQNQRVLCFSKGKEYRYFNIGRGMNVGYVVCEKNGEDERIVEIIRGVSIDAP
jgi:hypothetical protein